MSVSIYNAIWFKSTRFGRPFKEANVDDVLIEDAISEANASSVECLKKTISLTCVKHWCPNSYPIALAIKTALILYGDGEPYNTAVGGMAVSPAGIEPDEYISHIKRDSVGPLSRELDSPVKKEKHGKAVPDLLKRLCDLVINCSPPKGVGFVSLASLSEPVSGCNNCGQADKVDDIYGG